MPSWREYRRRKCWKWGVWKEYQIYSLGQHSLFQFILKKLRNITLKVGSKYYRINFTILSPFYFSLGQQVKIAIHMMFNLLCSCSSTLLIQYPLCFCSQKTLIYMGNNNSIWGLFENIFRLKYLLWIVFLRLSY